VKSALKLVWRFLYQAVFTSEDQVTLCLPESIKVGTAMALHVCTWSKFGIKKLHIWPEYVIFFCLNLENHRLSISSLHVFRFNF
jgi:hypothetical protein